MAPSPTSEEDTDWENENNKYKMPRQTVLTIMFKPLFPGVCETSTTSTLSVVFLSEARDLSFCLKQFEFDSCYL